MWSRKSTSLDEVKTLSPLLTCRKSKVYAGDVIYLMIEDDGFVHVEGFADLRIGSLPAPCAVEETGPDRFSECVFRIHPKFVYEMSKTLEKAVKRKLQGEELEILRQKASHEVETNTKIMSEIEQQQWAITYGQTIQLQHVKSGKFLIVLNRTLADMDKGRIKVGLIENGSSKAWLTFHPKFKTRTVGSHVHFEDFFTIHRAKHHDQCFNLSSFSYTRDQVSRREINIHHVGSNIQIKKFSEGVPSDATGLVVGQVYRIFHVEAEAFLTASSNQFKKKEPYLRQIAPDTIPQDAINLTLKALFVLEGSSRMQGGLVRAGKPYRMRHLATGLYLAIDSSVVSKTDEASTVSGVKTYSVTLSNKLDSQTCFGLYPSDNLSDESSSLIDSSSVRIMHSQSTLGRLWLHNTGHPKQNTTNKSKANLFFGASDKYLDQDSFRFMRADSEEVSDAHFILSCSKVLKLYKPRLELSIQEKRGLYFKEVDDIAETLRRIIFFLIHSSDSDPLLCEGRAHPNRQDQVRQSKLLDQLYSLIRTPIDCGIDIREITKKKEYRVVEKIQMYANKAIVNSCLDNLDSKLYVASKTFNSWDPSAQEHTYLNETMKQMGSGLGSRSVYSSLYSNNPVLLFKSVDSQLLDICSSTLVKSGVEADGVLNFLSILCHCDGKNIPVNQELILSKLYDLEVNASPLRVRHQVLIETCTSVESSRPVPEYMKKYVFDASNGVNYHDSTLKPMGMHLLNAGFPSLCVSWMSLDGWNPGSPGLFQTPAELGLSSTKLSIPSELEAYENRMECTTPDRLWIPLESIAWTLEPVVLYPKLHGKTWQSAQAEFVKQPSNKIRFDQLRRLARFYDLQLRLYSNLLLGRSAACTRILAEQFSYELLLSAISNDNLPYSIRTSFSNIFHRIWIHRFPHEPLEIPEIVRNVESIDRVIPSSDPLFHMFSLPLGHPALGVSDSFLMYPLANKFSVLQAVLHDLLVNISQNGQDISFKEENKFINSMLEMIEYLVAAGFYPDMPSFQRLCQSLIRALDGRADNAKNWARVAGDDNHDEMRRYSVDDKSLLVMQSKERMCSVLHSVARIWTDFRLTSILSFYKFSSSDTRLVEADDVQLSIKSRDMIESCFVDKQSGAPTLDLTALSEAPLVTICCDLMMYESPELFEAAFSFLVDIHSTREDAIFQALDTCLLEGSSCLEKLSQLKNVIGILKYDTELFQSRLIMDSTDIKPLRGINSTDIYSRTIENLKWLTAYCGRVTIDLSNQESTFLPDARSQNILLKLHVHSIVLHILDIDQDLLDSERNMKLQEIKRSCSQFLCKFLSGNPVTQEALYPYTTALMNKMDQDIEIGSVVVGIFSQNRRLCLQVPDEVIWTVAKMIESSEKDSRLESVLDFFATYVVPDGIPEKRNQTFLFRVLSNPQFKNICFVFTTGITPYMEAGSEELRSTAGYCEFLRMVSSAEPTDIGRTQYFKKFIMLCSAICFGKNCRTEIACQQLLPLNYCLTILLDSRIPYGVKVVMAQCFSDVYLDTDLDVDQTICTMTAMMNVLLHCSSTISSYVAAVYNSKSAPSTAVSAEMLHKVRHYTFKGVIPLLTNFFKYAYNPMADDLDSNFFHIVEALKSDIKSLLKRGNLDSAQQKICGDCGVAMGVFEELPDEYNPLTRRTVRHRSPIGGPKKEMTKQRHLSLVRSNTKHDFDEFKTALQHDELLQELIVDEFNGLIEIVNDIGQRTSRQDASYVSDRKKNGHKVVADRRSNTISSKDLCQRIVRHVLQHPMSPVAISAMELLSRLVAVKVVSEDERTHLQPVELKRSEEEHLKAQNFVAKCGAADLVVHLIAGNYSEAIVLKAIRLGIEILNNGNRLAQDLMYETFTKTDDKFFQQLDARLSRSMEKIKSERRDTKYEADYIQNLVKRNKNHDYESFDISVPPEIIFRFIQLLAEGHNIRMQEALLNQSSIGNTRNYSLVDRAAIFLALIAKDETHLQKLSEIEAELMISCWDFLIEIVQGPCPKNQEHLAESVMVEVFRIILTATFSEDLDKQFVKSIKAKAVKAAVSLLEGRSDQRIQKRLRQTLELKPLKRRLETLYEEFHHENLKIKSRINSTWDEEYLEEGFDLLTLAQSIFGDSADLQPKVGDIPKPDEYSTSTQFMEAMASYRSDLLYESSFNFFKVRHCSVEVWWGVVPHLDRIYFPMPSHCRLLPYATASKERFLECLDFGSDVRLTQFLEGSKGLDEELQHIELLSSYRMYNLVRPYIPLFKKASFALALLMNLAMLLSLTHGYDNWEYHYHPKSMEMSMTVFGFTQICLSSLVLLFMLVVRAPLVYQKRYNAYTALLMNSYKSSKRVGGPAAQLAAGLSMGGLKDTIGDITDVSGNAKRLQRGLSNKVTTFFHFYKPCFKWLFILATLQLMFVQAYPDVTPVFIFSILSVILLFAPALKSTRAYLENSITPFSFCFCCVYDVVMDKYTAFYIVYLITAGLGFKIHPSYYAYHLLDLVVMSTALQNVVRAVTRPRHTLIMTTIMGMFMIYFFTLAMFFFLPDDAWDPDSHRSHCKTMIRCFFTILHRGLLMGGGIGDYLTTELGYIPSSTNTRAFAVRTLYDLAFFVVVLVLLLNIIFGIIIDTFSELRSKANEKVNKMKNHCFICGIHSEKFDNHYMRQGIANGFSKHLSEEHNMWNYMYFLTYLRNKSKTECTGAESYVLESLENDDLSWIPQGMAICLNTKTEESVNQQLQTLKSDMKHVKGTLDRILTLKFPVEVEKI